MPTTTTADAEANADANDGEWLTTIIEQQQAEIELLRERVAASSCASSSSSGASSLDGHGCPSVRSAFSAGGSDDGAPAAAIAIDLERYARLCEDTEALNARLTARDAEHRELLGQHSQLHQDLERWRGTSQRLQRELERLVLDLANERRTKDEAIERAAQAMLQSEEAGARLGEVQAKLAALESDLAARSQLTVELERSHDRLRADASAYREQATSLQTTLALITRENAQLRARADAALPRQLEREGDVERLISENRQLVGRVEELQAVVEALTQQMHRQQEFIVDQDREYARMQHEVRIAHEQAQSHVTRQVESNLSLQSLTAQHTTTLRGLELRLLESEERAQMQDEEVLALRTWRRASAQRETQRARSYQELQASHRRLERSVQALETSRRKTLVELLQTKQQLEHCRAAVEAVDGDLVAMNRTLATFRQREVNVSRVLREYGKRNRQLQVAVKETRTQLEHVTESLRSSERRKQEIAVETGRLKRGLVVERCQREDLLRQCAELERCLASVQAAAGDSAGRAALAEKENGLLQHAVAQLCAYSSELQHAHAAMRQELQRLEIHGQRQPQVFG